MSHARVPARVAWAVDLLAPASGAEVLEVGCGPGVGVRILCDRMTEGRVTGIDRSATAIARARARNADHVAAGRALLHQQPLHALDEDGPPFDAALAVNVNLFWTGSAEAELAALRRRLRPAAPLWLVYEAPARDRARAVERAVTAALRRQGFAASTTWSDVPSLVAVCARG